VIENTIRKVMSAESFLAEDFIYSNCMLLEKTQGICVGTLGRNSNVSKYLHRMEIERKESPSRRTAIVALTRFLKSLYSLESTTVVHVANSRE
jgi:hypothetical protein